MKMTTKMMIMMIIILKEADQTKIDTLGRQHDSIILYRRFCILTYDFNICNAIERKQNHKVRLDFSATGGTN